MTAERLKRMREAQGLTQEQVAESLNVTRGAVGHWERGKNEPSYDVLIKLARLYNTSTAYLIGETDNPAPLEATQGATERHQDGKLPAGWDKLTQREKERVKRVTDGVRGILVEEILRDAREES